MAKHPYITFWIGDWIRDTRKMSLQARGAWIDLLCYMSLEKDKGVITGVITDFARLIGENNNTTEQVLRELEAKDICEVERLTGGVLKITSRRMVKDAAIAAQKSEAGKKGMKNRYQKKKVVTDSVITKPITEQQQNSGNGIGNGNDIEDIEIGGVGEREDEPGIAPPVISVDECVALYESPAYEMMRNGAAQMCNISPAMLVQWAHIFGKHLKSTEGDRKVMQDFPRHFLNWLKRKAETGTDLQQPEKYFSNGATANNGQHTRNGKSLSAANTGGRTNGTAVVKPIGSFYQKGGKQ